MKDLPLNALRAFALVYKTGGVRPAARELMISHSSVSRHVRELEAGLGVPLFEKPETRHRLQLTAQGRALGKTVLESLGAMENAVASLKEARRQNAVVISTPPSFAVRWLLPRLVDLQLACPSVEISIVTEQAVVAPGAGGIDVSIRMGTGPWPDVSCQAMMDDVLYPVVHPSHMAALNTARPAEIFETIALLHDRDPSASWQQWFEKYPVEGVDLRAGARFTSSDLVLRAAAQRLGVALARGALVADDIQSGALVTPFGDQHINLGTAYWIITEKNTHEKWAARQVIDWLLKEGGEDGS